MMSTHREGEGGYSTPKADAVRKLSKGGCVKKIGNFCKHHMYMPPKGDDIREVA